MAIKLHLGRALVGLTALLALSAMPARASAQGELPEPLPILELQAPGGGYLYTLNPREAERAVTGFGFSLAPEPVAHMWNRAFPGSQPLYRLRWRPRPSYLLTSSTLERDALVARGAFVYEGVVGYAQRLNVEPQEGMTPLWRYSNNGVWQLTLESGRAELERRGFRADGRLGYVIGDETGEEPPPEEEEEVPPESEEPPASEPPRTAPKRSTKLRRAIKRCQRKHRGSKQSTKRARKRCVSRARKKYARR
jgi:hypothetical protein